LFETIDNHFDQFWYDQREQVYSDGINSEIEKQFIKND